MVDKIEKDHQRFRQIVKGKFSGDTRKPMMSANSSRAAGVRAESPTVRMPIATSAG